MTPAIEIVALSKTFRRALKQTRALDAVSLNVQMGEMVALIGASGSGKSTLIRHLAGLVSGDRDGSEGMVRILGEVVQSRGTIAREIRRIRRRVGVVFQQFNLVGRLTVLTNVVLGAIGRVPLARSVFALFPRDERLRAMEALSRVGLAEAATQRASTLSGGQQQRAAIARTLVQQAEIILADEPIASLDPESARRVMEDLTRINREDGTTVVVSLHQVDFAIRYCPRTVAMRDGRIVYDGSSTALTHRFLREIYGADSEELVLPGTIEDLEFGRAPRRPVLPVDQAEVV